MTGGKATGPFAGAQNDRGGVRSDRGDLSDKEGIEAFITKIIKYANLPVLIKERGVGARADSQPDQAFCRGGRFGYGRTRLIMIDRRKADTVRGALAAAEIFPRGGG